MMPDNTTIILGEPDTAILLALNRFQYLTAFQASRLLYPNLNDNNRYATRRLKRLVDAGFALRLGNLPTPRYGSAPHVFALARLGRQYLNRIGIETPGYFRPSEESEKAFNRPFMQHTLCAIDVLLAAELVGRVNNISCPRIMSERELKRSPLRVELEPPPGSEHVGPRTVAVIPDGWFQLAIGNGAPSSIAIELDRGTEEQKFWRRKVAALVLWANGPYRVAFETDNVTIAVVTPDPARRDTLRAWTVRELASRGWSDDEEIFLFTSADPVTTSPETFFFGRVWYLPSQDVGLSLVDRPEDEQQYTQTAFA